MLFCIGVATTIYAQDIAIKFSKIEERVRRDTTEVIVAVKLEVDKIENIDDKSKYTLTAKVDDAKSTLPKSAYSIDFNTITLDKLSRNYTFYIRIKKDDESDRDRSININLEILKVGETNPLINRAPVDSSTFSLIVQAIQALNNYNYLAYIGTNFDLVDGVQAKNLFFATSIFKAPLGKKQGFGFTLTLYGNRTTTVTDTTGRVDYISKIVPLKGDSARYYTENALKTINRVSDNLGASFSPLISIGNFSSIAQFYYAPQFEFIWRRTTITTQYNDSRIVDSLDRPNRPIIRPITITDPITKTPVNVYDIYLGIIGGILNHSNKYISVRIQAAIGWNFTYAAGRGSGVTRDNEIKMNYSRHNQAYLYARTWITEPTSGVTIGAEVSNTLFRREKAQPYWNVTLSKAIDLSALGAVFKPVISR